jgi:hypothetical protein
VRQAKKARLMVIVDLVNRLMGRETLFWGTQGMQQEWKTRAQWLSQHSTTRWEELLIVT